MDPIILQQSLTALQAAFLAVCQNPKPSYSINGQSISWNEYRKQLIEDIEATNKLLILAQGPGEFVLEGLT